MNDSTNCLADYRVHLDGQALLIASPDGAAATWGWDPAARRLQYEGGVSPDFGATLAAVGAALSDLDGERQATLALQVPAELNARLRTLGIALPVPDSPLLEVPASLFWQCQAGWLPQAAAPMPLDYRMTEGRRHPLRRAKPQGEVYRRRIDWLGQTLSFQVADVEADLPHFHRWMNDPHVAEFWQEEGDLARQRAYLERVSADPHALPLIAFLDGRPFGYFEVYWAKEDRLAPYYDVQDYDRGWHVLIGEADCRGAPYVSAWLPSISHYLFLDDCRTQRLVIEPRADNRRMRRNLARSGYALVKEFDFPHKRAVLGTLLRERFFAERLWLPQPA